MTDEEQIRHIVDQLIEGWNAGDGVMFARPFADDADFTAITGLQARGRDLIARGHDEILSTIYRGTKNSANIEWIRFVRPDVAIALVRLTLRYDNGEAFPMRPALASMVVTRENGTWMIRSFHNMIPFERPPAGPLERERLQ